MNMQKIIDRLGGAGAVGRMCGITRQAVCAWRRVPDRFVLVIAGQSDVTPHEMRPDRYPHPLDGRRKPPKRRR